MDRLGGYGEERGMVMGIADHASQIKECLTEIMTCPSFWKFRPQQRHQGFPAQRPTHMGGQICQQGAYFIRLEFCYKLIIQCYRKTP